jgi:hypothetical protein
LAESLAIHVTSCQIKPISNNDMNKGRIEKSWGIKRRESYHFLHFGQTEDIELTSALKAMSGVPLASGRTSLRPPIPPPILQRPSQQIAAWAKSFYNGRDLPRYGNCGSRFTIRH